MNIGKTKYLVVLILLMSLTLGAQNDTIQLKNSDVLLGEIKSFSTGILVIETSYSDEDFRIEFNKVKAISVQRKCIIGLTQGRRRYGNIRSDAQGKVTITDEDGNVEHFKLEEITFLQEISDNFWDRFRGNIDLGFNFTKANHDTQFTTSGQLEYISEIWLFSSDINVLSSSQDSVAKTKRRDAKMELKRILPRKWYLLGALSYLSNTEQALDARYNPNLGIGKLLKSTNKLYLGVTVGFAYNIENYVDASLDKTSTEVFISSGFNMFDYKDFDLKTTIKFYYSLSEKGRFRTDYDLNLKYDMPLNFYIKLGFTLNYDNQSAISGSDFDYILSSGLGWKFNK